MVTIILIVLAGMFNAIMDKLQFHLFKSRLPKGAWWDAEHSWKLKWKDGDPNKGERFFLSSSLLVFVTDAWHLFKFLLILSVTMSAVFYVPVLNVEILGTDVSYLSDIIMLRLIFGLSFTTTFGPILTKKQ